MSEENTIGVWDRKFSLPLDWCLAEPLISVILKKDSKFRNSIPTFLFWKLLYASLLHYSKINWLNKEKTACRLTKGELITFILLTLKEEVENKNLRANAIKRGYTFLNTIDDGYLSYEVIRGAPNRHDCIVELKFKTYDELIQSAIQKTLNKGEVTQQTLKLVRAAKYYLESKFPREVFTGLSRLKGRKFLERLKNQFYSYYVIFAGGGFHYREILEKKKEINNLLKKEIQRKKTLDDFYRNSIKNKDRRESYNLEGIENRIKQFNRIYGKMVVSPLSSLTEQLNISESTLKKIIKESSTIYTIRRCVHVVGGVSRKKALEISSCFRENERKGVRIVKGRNFSEDNKLYKIVKLIPSIRMPRKNTPEFVKITYSSNNYKKIKKYIGAVVHVNDKDTRQIKLSLRNFNNCGENIPYLSLSEKKEKHYWGSCFNEQLKKFHINTDRKFLSITRFKKGKEKMATNTQYSSWNQVREANRRNASKEEIVTPEEEVTFQIAKVKNKMENENNEKKAFKKMSQKEKEKFLKNKQLENRIEKELKNKKSKVDSAQLKVQKQKEIEKEVKENEIKKQNKKIEKQKEKNKKSKVDSTQLKDESKKICKKSTQEKEELLAQVSPFEKLVLSIAERWMEQSLDLQKQALELQKKVIENREEERKDLACLVAETVSLALKKGGKTTSEESPPKKSKVNREQSHYQDPFELIKEDNRKKTKWQKECKKRGVTPWQMACEIVDPDTDKKGWVHPDEYEYPSPKELFPNIKDKNKRNAAWKKEVDYIREVLTKRWSARKLIEQDIIDGKDPFTGEYPLEKKKKKMFKEVSEKHLVLPEEWPEGYDNVEHERYDTAKSCRDLIIKGKLNEEDALTYLDDFDKLHGLGKYQKISRSEILDFGANVNLKNLGETEIKNSNFRRKVEKKNRKEKMEKEKSENFYKKFLNKTVFEGVEEEINQVR